MEMFHVKHGEGDRAAVERFLPQCVCAEDYP